MKNLKSTCFYGIHIALFCTRSLVWRHLYVPGGPLVSRFVQFQYRIFAFSVGLIFDLVTGKYKDFPEGVFNFFSRSTPWGFRTNLVKKMNCLLIDFRSYDDIG